MNKAHLIHDMDFCEKRKCQKKDELLLLEIGAYHDYCTKNCCSSIDFPIIRHSYKSFSSSRGTRVIVLIIHLRLDIYDFFKPTIHVSVWANAECIIELLGHQKFP